MSNERFDRLMKKNLESVRPAYRPQAWSRFQKQLPATGIANWLSRYGGWGLSMLMLTGWLTTLYTLRENQRLLVQLTQQQASKTPIAQSVPNATPGNIPSHPDTVFVVKRTIVEHQYVAVPGSQKMTDLSATHKPGSQRPVVNQPDNIQNEPTALATETDKRTRRRTPSVRPEPFSVDEAGVAQQRSPKPRVNSKGLGQQPRVAAEATTPSNTTTQISLGNRENQPSVYADTMSSEIRSLVRTDSTQLSPTKPDTIALTQPNTAPSKPKEAESAPTATASPKQSRPTFRLSSLKPRLGMEFIGTLDGVGVGPQLEVFLADNLGLSTGVQASALIAENHHELRDFNSATGQEFLEQYKAYLPTFYDQIRDISVLTSLISLPVSLKYYLPLRRNWSVVFQTGTRFDLNTYQEVRYESFLRGDEKHHSFETHVQTPLFHNFMFGAGVQYQRSRLGFQLSPYYLYDFRRGPNDAWDSHVGVKASVWLNLFK